MLMLRGIISAYLVPEREERQTEMGIIAWIILGLIAGVLAKLIMPGRDPGGFIMTIVIGIVGGLLGGFIGRLLGFHGVTGINISSILWSVLGAIVLLAIYRVVAARRV